MLELRMVDGNQKYRNEWGSTMCTWLYRYDRRGVHRAISRRRQTSQTILPNHSLLNSYPREIKMSQAAHRYHNRDNELFSACEAGDVERVHRVITDGVDPKKATNQRYFNESPVHTACR